MYKNLSIVYDKLMDVDYATYKNIIDQELVDKKDLLILDLGCGSGALIEHLANYGKVYGIDKSEEMLSLASNKYPKASYIAMDLLDIKNINQTFDFVVSAFDVLNYLDNIKQFERAIKNVFDSLEDGGIFVFDIHTPHKINKMIDTQLYAYEDDDINYIWFTYDTENVLEVESEITFFIKDKNNLYKKVYEFQKQRTYNISDINKILLSTGFKIKDYFCDFDKENKNYNDSERIIYICEK
ncbi:class I SAM-dependent methyltransferase [Gemella sp. GH3]|uniref:class I SAM-dependent DNA methyltransferase n=1 Tax=unclassified Gemella TaxID=2624949 RepID=UPI0015D0B862|nr:MULTISPECIES: class I SAM-dependent methyltransferase [unclassified Gemella]MBF0713959.1 class I SAM-dependent methyltransferase [Gemella sp. GH3.1]NYS50911.1 class I SAM-dependent methyltransferase [Gemella sp. GH3]